MDETQYWEPICVGSFKCGKKNEKTVTITARGRKMTPEDQEEIERLTINCILGIDA